jgi:hypothetical protein
VLEALREFAGDDSIRFCGASISNDSNDLKMVEYYGLATIPEARDLKMFKYVYLFQRYLSNKPKKSLFRKNFKFGF